MNTEHETKISKNNISRAKNVEQHAYHRWVDTTSLIIHFTCLPPTPLFHFILLSQIHRSFNAYSMVVFTTSIQGIQTCIKVHLHVIANDSHQASTKALLYDLFLCLTAGLRFCVHYCQHLTVVTLWLASEKWSASTKGTACNPSSNFIITVRMVVSCCWYQGFPRHRPE